MIRGKVVRMGGLASDMIRQSVEAVVQNDTDLGRQVIDTDDVIDRLEAEILNDTMLCVGLEAPVASDLRFLVATLGIVSELEKAADHGVKLARRGRKLAGRFPSEFKLALTEICDDARRLLASALRLYTSYEAELAEEIILSDEDVDRRFAECRSKMMDLIEQAPEDTELLLRAINVFHALEHVADHAVAIAKRLQYAYEDEHRLANLPLN